MPFVLLIFGVAFVASGFHGNASKLFSLIKGEFSGTPSFGKWVIAILAIGATGYIKQFKPISDAFIVLVLVVLFLSNKGFFAKFSEQFLNNDSSNLLSLNAPPTGNFSIQPSTLFKLPNLSGVNNG